jgi:hypothetical protein
LLADERLLAGDITRCQRLIWREIIGHEDSGLIAFPDRGYTSDGDRNQMHMRRNLGAYQGRGRGA